jgi:hypothetical protein
MRKAGEISMMLVKTAAGPHGRRPISQLHLAMRTTLLIVLMLLSSSATLPPTNSAESALEQQVRNWIDQLSKQPAFADWKSASPDIQPLGPGTHGWLALLVKNGQTVGYMVVHARPEGGFRLGEYGIGPHALFDPAALRRTLLENGLIDREGDPYEAEIHYVHPFAAVWRVTVGPETIWVDGKTNEWLPIKAEDMIQLQLRWQLEADGGQSGDDSDAVGFRDAEAIIGKSFDVYDKLPWVTGAAPLQVQNQKKVQSLIRKGLHIRYVTEPYGDAVLYAVPVIGYVRHDGDHLDLGVDMAGLRFIPIENLMSRGRFYL